jgi:hypothetical protein
MRQVAFQCVVMAVVGSMLAGCAVAESRSPAPEFMRMKEAEPPPPEPAPDVKLAVRKNLSSIFLVTSYPRDVRVSAPHHAVRGPGWTACVRADLTSATGTPLGPQTYRLGIAGGDIVDRRRVGNEDNCASEHYTPVLMVK